MRISTLKDCGNEIVVSCVIGLNKKEVYHLAKRDLNGFELKQEQRIEVDSPDNINVKTLTINEAVIFSLSNCVVLGSIAKELAPLGAL